MVGYKSDINRAVIEDMTSAELHAAIKNSGQILPVLPSVIAPTINAAHDFQSTDWYINLVETTISDVGTCQQYICINSVTKGFHTEKDVTYTVINVHVHQMGKSEIKYHFIFTLRERYNVSILVTDGVSIVFYGVWYCDLIVSDIYLCTVSWAHIVSCLFIFK